MLLSLATGLVSAAGAFISWLAKLRWSSEMLAVKEAQLAAKDEIIRLKQVEIDLLQELSSPKLREHYQSTKAQLEEIIESLKSDNEASREQIRGLGAGLNDNLPARIEAQANEERRLIEERSSLVARLTTMLEIVQDELQRSEERFRVLKGANSICPLCEEPLSESKRRELGWRLREERSSLKEREAELRNQLGTVASNGHNE